MSEKAHPSKPAAEAIPAVILAAGKGTRMKGQEPKAAVRVAGRPMAVRVADAMRGAGISRIIAVVGHRAGDVRAAIGDGVEYVIQDKQLGTGHAARCAAPSLVGYEGPVVIAYADIPLLTKDDVSALIEEHVATSSSAALLTAVFDEPGSLGRIIRGSDGRVRAIVEARDASPEQLKITETNVGVYCFQAPLIFEILKQLRNENAQQQYYLTDAVGILVGRKQSVHAVALKVADNGIGVDTQDDLHRARRLSALGEVL